MDEIDLLECVGKGGYGCVYKASWRGAGVAVKYIVCPVEDSESLGRAIREVVLSKKMSHPNVVQCYAWTVLTGAVQRGAVQRRQHVPALWGWTEKSVRVRESVLLPPDSGRLGAHDVQSRMSRRCQGVVAAPAPPPRSNCRSPQAAAPGRTTLAPWAAVRGVASTCASTVQPTTTHLVGRGGGGGQATM